MVTKLPKFAKILSISVNSIGSGQLNYEVISYQGTDEYIEAYTIEQAEQQVKTFTFSRPLKGLLVTANNQVVRWMFYHQYEMKLILPDTTQYRGTFNTPVLDGTNAYLTSWYKWSEDFKTFYYSFIIYPSKVGEEISWPSDTVKKIILEAASLNSSSYFYRFVGFY